MQKKLHRFKYLSNRIAGHTRAREFKIFVVEKSMNI